MAFHALHTFSCLLWPSIIFATLAVTQMANCLVLGHQSSGVTYEPRGSIADQRAKQMAMKDDDDDGYSDSEDEGEGGEGGEGGAPGAADGMSKSEAKKKFKMLGGAVSGGMKMVSGAAGGALGAVGSVAGSINPLSTINKVGEASSNLSSTFSEPPTPSLSFSELR